MKTSGLIICMLIGFLASCGDDNEIVVPANTDACINQKAMELEAQGAYPDFISIDQYAFRDDTIYLFTAPCCDLFDYLLDRDCDTLCASGGFSGMGDGRCPGFPDSAVFVRRIWQK
jgi:hypothetical protein